MIKSMSMIFLLLSCSLCLSEQNMPKSIGSQYSDVSATTKKSNKINLPSGNIFLIISAIMMIIHKRQARIKSGLSKDEFAIHDAGGESGYLKLAKKERLIGFVCLFMWIFLPIIVAIFTKNSFLVIFIISSILFLPIMISSFITSNIKFKNLEKINNVENDKGINDSVSKNH